MILSRVRGCDCRRVLDWMIKFTDLIHSTRNYRQLERYRWSLHFTVHRYLHTSVISVHQLYPGNGFITVSLSLQHTWSHLFAAYFLSCHLFSIIRLPSPETFSILILARVRVRVNLRLAVYRQSVHLDAKPLETHNQHFFQLNTCGYSPYVTSSLTRV
jgi:hypothetical protein